MENKIQKYRSTLVAVMVAVIAFAGTIATKWIASDLEPRISKYKWIAYVIGGIFFVVSIVLAVRTAGESGGASSNRSITIGGSANSSTNIAGDKNTVSSSRKR